MTIEAETKTKYETVTTIAQLNKWIEKAMCAGVVGLDTETDTVIATRAKLAGISLSTQPGEGCYIPVGHAGVEQLELSVVLEKLKPLLVHPLVIKVLHNAKYDLVVLNRYGVQVSPIEDTMLMSYSMFGGKHRHNMDELASIYLGHTTITFSEVTGKGANKLQFKDVALEPATSYAAEDADVTMGFWKMFVPSLADDARSLWVYENLDKPLVPIVQRMEEAGILVDIAHLQRLTEQFTEKMDGLLGEMYAMAGVEFNPASPKQLGELFRSMGVDTGEETASGQMATGVDILEEVEKDESVPQNARTLIRLILDWRKFAKLVGTYTTALQDQVHPRDGRIHTSFGLASTITGRLASSDPNLQNIPVRTDEGKQLRVAFIAATGHKIISADYSQIELRVVAMASQDKAMLKAFEQDFDIHQAMAAELNEKPFDEVTKDERRDAKTVNFGIVYGTSAFGLARNQGISEKAAQKLIDNYFARFPGIKTYLDNAVKYAREHGYVRTYFGRRIWLPDINHKFRGKRGHAERQAVNGPIQGTAADVVKLAIIAVDKLLTEGEFKTRMLLQVHDELVFEAPDDEVDIVMPKIVAVMENVVKFPGVKLKVEAAAGLNWEEAH